jgi:hypothetical protein
MAGINDVVSLVTVNGEYIGKFVSEDTVGVTLKDPHMVTPNGESIGFLPAVCLTGEQKPAQVTFNKSCVTLVIKSQEEVAKSYREATSGLVLPS